ncbi:MAG: hypothetical protein R3Y23_06190 [Bacillota bacterium]
MKTTTKKNVLISLLTLILLASVIVGGTHMRTLQTVYQLQATPLLRVM